MVAARVLPARLVRANSLTGSQVGARIFQPDPTTIGSAICRQNGAGGSTPNQVRDAPEFPTLPRIRMFSLSSQYPADGNPRNLLRIIAFGLPAFPKRIIWLQLAAPGVKK